MAPLREKDGAKPAWAPMHETDEAIPILDLAMTGREETP
jgi:hypothetical protein